MKNVDAIREQNEILRDASLKEIANGIYRIGTIVGLCTYEDEDRCTMCEFFEPGVPCCEVALEWLNKELNV